MATEEETASSTTPEGAVGGSAVKDLPAWFEETYPKATATFVVFYRGLW